MASIHRRPRSKFWHAAWRKADGTLVLRSTKLTDKAAAQAMALEWERAEKLAGSGSLTEAQCRKIMAEILERCGSGEELRCPSITKFLTDWTAQAAASKGESTAVKYSHVVDEFLKHLDATGNKPLTSLTARHVEGFIAARVKLGLSPSTVAQSGAILRTAFARAVRQGLLSVNPATMVELPKSSSVQRETFTPAEVRLLLDACDGEWKTALLFGFYTGCRLTDACQMEWGKVDLVKNTITFVQRKTAGEVTMPLHPDLLAHLTEIATGDKPERYITPGLAELGTGGAKGLSTGFRRIMHAAGVDAKPVEREQGKGRRQLCKRSFHSLRHSFASALANAGVSEEVRCSLTGHRDAKSHAGYTHLQVATLRSAIEKLPSL